MTTIATRTGAKALHDRSGRSVTAADTEAFVRTIGGAVVRPGDANYNEARKLWNGMIDRFPGLIVRCANDDDVAGCVRFAAAHDIELAVRGGGHSFPGHSQCNGGLTIDLSQMKRIDVDAAAGVAVAEAGVLWGELDAATSSHGLAVPGGQISHTGIAGLTLGGGIGWLSRRFGLTSDNLRAVLLVSADGTMRRVTAEDDPELFWGLCGGGGNFGVVTSFEYQLHPLGHVVGGLILHPLPAAPTVFRQMRDYLATSPRELTVTLALLHSPDGHPCCGAAVCYSGDAAKADAAIAPLLATGKPVMAQVGPMPYTALQGMLDASAEPGRRYYMRSHTLESFSDGAIDTLAEHYGRVPSPMSIVVLPQMGGAIADRAAHTSAFGQRHAAYTMSILGAWTDAGHDEQNINWAKATSHSMAKYQAGVYVNELGDEGSERIRDAYGADNFERLVALKTKHDRNNLFRLNQNIAPLR